MKTTVRYYHDGGGETTTTTTKKKRGQRLFRYKNENREQAAHWLLEQADLTPSDVPQFLNGASPNFRPNNRSTQAYRRRRAEISTLVDGLQSGTSRIDVDGRLVPVQDEGRTSLLPPLPPLLPNNNNNDIPHPTAPPPPEMVIARAVARYKKMGVPMKSLQLIKVDPHTTIVNNNNNPLTLRRIVWAVAAVVVSFLCLLLQTLPIGTADPYYSYDSDPLFDVLFGKQRDVLWQAEFCGGKHLDRSSPRNHHPPHTSRVMAVWEAIMKLLHRNVNGSIDCSDGVLHIPTISFIRENSMGAKTAREIELWSHFSVPHQVGFNVTWDLTCRPPSNRTRCFRGVHDGLFTNEQLAEVFQFGRNMSSMGGDPFRIIVDNTESLKTSIPTTVETLSKFLGETYGINVEPVAFRVNAVGPMNGYRVPMTETANDVSSLLNKKLYFQWVDRVARHNDIAQVPLPWPFKVKPKRDTCNLLADLDADPSFQVHTTVFLAEEGQQFHGGAALYVDYEDKLRDKIQRGLTVDGSFGRLLVSTGGRENRRCRLPVRSGTRAALQIWWSITGDVC